MGAGYGRRGLQAGLMGMGVVLALAAPAAAAETPTFSKDVAPILQAKCQAVPSAELDRADVADDLQEARPWARSIKERVSHAADAAVAYRQERRRAEIQERHVAQRRADRHHRPLGRWRRAAGRSEGPAAGQAAGHQQRVAGRDGRLRPARPGRSSRPSTRCRRSTRTCGTARQSTIPITEPRWIRMVEIRPTNLKARKIVASLRRLPGAEPRQRPVGQYRHCAGARARQRRRCWSTAGR